ncbi:MAG: LPXTG cell wall anchor domain-containing protein [Defluviitaleaceae bacterium]|nr:LPXTG cell wall anchor domain-containing protein [Defluviitaleaceae bacterium]
MRNAMKKFVAAVLTVAMLMSMVTVAFANPPTTPNQVTNPGDITLRDHNAEVSLTIHHWLNPFIDGDTSYAWSPFATPLPSFPHPGPGSFHPDFTGRVAVEDARWHAVRLNAPAQWAGNAIPTYVTNFFAHPDAEWNNATGALIAGFGGGTTINGWSVSSLRVTDDTDTDGIVHWNAGDLHDAVADFTAAGQLANPGRAQGMWLVWEEYVPGGPHTGEDTMIHDPFLVNLPTFVHRPNNAGPTGDFHIGGAANGRWVIGGSPDMEYLQVWYEAGSMWVYFYDGTGWEPGDAPNGNRVYQNRPGYWVYHVNVFPKPSEPPILEKEIRETRPGMVYVPGPDLGSGPTPGHWESYTVLEWEFRIGIPAELGAADRYPVNNPANTPAPGNGSNLPLSVTGASSTPMPSETWLDVAPSPTTDPGTVQNAPIPGTPATYGQVPYFPNRYGYINQNSFAIVRDVLDWRLRLDPDSVELTFDTAVYDPGPSTWTFGNEEFPRTAGPGPLGAVHWILVNTIINFDPQQVPPGSGNWVADDIVIPNNTPGVPARVVEFCPLKHVAGMEQGINVFWIHLTDAGRQYIAANHGRVFNSDEPDYGFIRIEFDTIARLVTDQEFEGGNPDIHGVIRNEGTLNFGRDPMVNSSDRDPGDDDNTETLMAIRINKINPSRDTLDGAVFFLWHADDMTGDGTEADPRVPISVAGPAGPNAFEWPAGSGDFVRPPIRRAISGPEFAIVGSNNYQLVWDASANGGEGAYVLPPVGPGRIPATLPSPALAGTTTSFFFAPIFMGSTNPLRPHEMYGQRAGQATFNGLPEGDWYLLEFQAPPGGYRRIEGFRRITLYADTGYAAQSNAYTVGVYVTNTRDFELPLTGGAGTIMFTAAGVSLMGGAGLFLFLARKKDKARSK